MTLKNTLQNYFNSGSPEKRTKRRIGGLVIAVTAIALAAAMIVLIVSAFASIGNGKDKGNTDGTEGSKTASVETREVNIDEINAPLANKTVVLDDNHLGELTASQYTIMGSNARPQDVVDTAGNKVTVYGVFNMNTCALQNEALAAFNAMSKDFYNAEQKKLYVSAAYEAGKANTGLYASALTVQLNAANADFKDTSTSIYNHTDKDYEWIYDNAHLYGFVRVSDVEGEENVFRYVGIAHAKYLEDNNSDDEIVTMSQYLEDIKTNTSADSPRKISNVENAMVEGAKKANYYVYFIYHGDTYKIPNPDKYSFTVDNVGNGIIITCTEK